MQIKDHVEKLIDPAKNASISLVPNSGIQFLDYGLALSMAPQEAFRFLDEQLPPEETRQGIVKRTRVHALERNPAPADTDPDDRTYRSLVEGGPQRVVAESSYQVQPMDALERFDRQWMPVPFFKATSAPGKHDAGPTNWARVYLALPPKAERRTTPARLVIAFDTEILPKLVGKVYAGPEEADASDPGVTFSLVKTMDRQLSFAAGAWQREWIRDSYIAGLIATGNEQRAARLPQESGEPWAQYVAYLQSLLAMLQFPTIDLIDVFGLAADAMQPGGRSRRLTHLDVDLILDVGNSRTCGILIEQGAGQDSIGIGQPPARLELRDFSRPELVSSRPFESHVEFQPASFGRSEHGRDSGRPGAKDAFRWPSSLRTGAEAAWLASKTDGRDGISGMSSPKRYVWEKSRRTQNWVNNRAGRATGEPLPSIISATTSKLAPDGRIAPAGARRELARQYSRGSMYMLLLAEVICHALTQINSARYRLDRANPNVPRRLRKIFITLPSATPVAEQAATTALIRKAVRLVWAACEWGRDDWLHPIPKVFRDWDEATCTQLVYLYNELEHRFQSFPKAFFEATGRGRQVDGCPAMRIATIDVGGGTTDLMIIEHHLFDEIITPHQLFREGFRQAGDDIVKEVIEKSVLPVIASALEHAGVAHAAAFINSLFGGDTSDVTRTDQVRRALFVSQVLAPAALRLMQDYEHTDSRFPASGERFCLRDVVPAGPPQIELMRYLDEAVAPQVPGFSSGDIELVMHGSEVAAAVHAVLGRAIEDICEAVRAYDCDIVLVTGRPSALPAVRDLVLANAPAPPERIVNMYGYRIGNWYPFRSDDSRIRDPKTTAAVGALLCYLCQGKHASFVFQSQLLAMKSTARYVGKMDQQGRIADSDVLFQNKSDQDESEEEFTARMGPRLDIGYRQLPIERWVTSQLYHVFYKNDEVSRSLVKPVKLTMRRQKLDDGEEAETDDQVARAAQKAAQVERGMEQFEILAAEDARQKKCLDDVDLRLQTVRTIDQVEAGYWLDTGVLRTTHLLRDDRDNA
ncbi:MAG TPA: virulence factor SrfB [Hyphomonadaceae bacterium]|nr:virulence factor SrfB [Hyphomonadaceae bacterium]